MADIKTTTTVESSNHIRMDARDKLWELSFNIFYDAYFEEIVADQVQRRWEILDEITKVLVALTASGSAVSGWALWNQPGFRSIWVTIAAIGALLAIIHASLRVPERVKDWGSNEAAFTGLRIDLETFRYRMELDPEFSVEEFTKDFVQFRQRFGDLLQRRKSDVLLTNRLKDNAQTEVNARLKDQISEGAE